MTLSTAPAPEGAPEPASVTFSDFGLHPDVLRAVTAAGYITPTPIQAKAIPVVMQRRDVVAGEGVAGQVFETAAHLLQADDVSPFASPQIMQASAQGGADAVDVPGK